MTCDTRCASVRSCGSKDRLALSTAMTQDALTKSAPSCASPTPRAFAISSLPTDGSDKCLTASANSRNARRYWAPPYNAASACPTAPSNAV